MSPPVLHADLTFNRTGSEPTFQQAIESTMDTPYDQCQIVDHYGPNVPGEPDLRKTTTTGPPTSTTPNTAGGCSQILARKMEQMKNDDISAQSEVESSDESVEEECYQLNGLNLNLDMQARQTNPEKVMNVSDVQVLFTTPSPPCDPCDVTYKISAKIEDDEYIAVGFKGRSWERDFPLPPVTSRPCYFGMCMDAFDNYTSDRIALGYTANGGCVREMVAKNYVGTPSDVDYKILKGTSVERSGGRTTLRFTISQHWLYPNASSLGSKDGPWRIMWAIGQVSGGDACAASVGFHFNHRGVAPLKWLTSGSTSCTSPPSPPTPTPTAPSPSSPCPGGSFAACISLCPSDPPEWKACLDVCHKRCDVGPSPAPSPPTPSPLPPAQKCDICNTGSCAACKPCAAITSGPCAPCWAKQSNGSACLPDCQDAGCWNTTLRVDSTRFVV